MHARQNAFRIPCFAFTALQQFDRPQARARLYGGEHLAAAGGMKAEALQLDLHLGTHLLP